MHKDVVGIKGIEIDCVVGVYPHERDIPQRLIADVSMVLDTSATGARERISSTVDYHQAAAQVVFILETCRFRLIETAGHALARLLLLPSATKDPRPRVERVEICLTKPKALDGKAIPYIRVERDASWGICRRKEECFGSVDLVYETPEVGIYRLNIKSRGVIPLHVHPDGEEFVFVMGDGISCDGRPVAPGTIHQWAPGAAHSYENGTDLTQSLLCVRAPPLARKRDHCGDEPKKARTHISVKEKPPWPD